MPSLSKAGYCTAANEGIPGEGLEMGLFLVPISIPINSRDCAKETLHRVSGGILLHDGGIGRA
jgi:hypothetical protein